MADVVLSEHDEAMSLIFGAHTVSMLSYEEAIAIYLRARGILVDHAAELAAEIPPNWKPPRPLSIDSAWAAVQAEDALKAVRAKLSIHDLRTLIRVIATSSRPLSPEGTADAE
jgi:hypothetical protein